MRNSKYILSLLLLAAVSATAQVLERSSPNCSPEAQERARAGVERNDATSIYLMARYYSTGKCLPGDGQKAIEHYWKAAKLNYPPAYYNLGIVSAGNKDYESAELLFFRGTQLGHRGAELQLGILYSLVPPPIGNDEKAFAWLSVTVNRNEAISGEAKESLATVTRRMDASSRERAEALYRGLNDKYGLVPAFSQ